MEPTPPNSDPAGNILILGDHPGPTGRKLTETLGEDYRIQHGASADNVNALTDCSHDLVLWSSSGHPPPETCWHTHAAFKASEDSPAFALLNVPRGTGLSLEALQRGADGLFYSDDSIELLTKGVTTLLGGGMWYPRHTLERFISEQRLSEHKASDHHILTTREKQILRLVAAGASNAEIARTLYISLSTVKSHLYRIYDKIDVPNRIQATLWTLNNL